MATSVANPRLGRMTQRTCRSLAITGGFEECPDQPTSGVPRRTPDALAGSADRLSIPLQRARNSAQTIPLGIDMASE